MATPSRFFYDQRGAVSVILGLVFVVVVGVIGLAVDTARVNVARSAIKGAADAAALAAVSVGAQELKNGKRRKLAKMYFHANCNEGCGKIKSLKVRFKDGGDTVQVIAKAEVATTLGQVLGLNTMAADVKSVASAKKGYAEVYLVLDNSESMNIPNTDADIQKLIDILPTTWVPNGCAFACHGTSETVDGQSYYEVSRDNNIELRQDYVRKSAIELVDILEATERAGQFSVGVMPFNFKLYVEQEVTDDLDKARAALSSLPGADDYTDFDKTMTEVIRLVGSNGVGSIGDPVKIVVIVTDGAQNKQEREHGTIDAADCAEIKDAGGTQVVVLHILYPDLDHYYPGHGVNNKVVPYTEERLEKLAECASPGFYFEANQGESITVAFKEIAEAIVKRTPALIQ